MLTEAQVKGLCYPKSYLRGCKLLDRPQAVIDRNADWGIGDEVEVFGRVLASGSFSERYDTYLYLDETFEIEGYDCSCAAARNYEGMCKHAVALALCMIREPETFIEGKQVIYTDTNAHLQKLMQRKHRGGLVDIEPGSVRLIPTLDVTYSTWDLSLKITNGEFDYVVKNISELIERIQENTYFSYGKKLAFTHSESAFDEPSLKIIKFLKRCLDLRNNEFSRWSSYYMADVKRELRLSNNEVAEFLELNNPGSVLVKDTYHGEGIASVESREFNLNVDITQRADGGYEISCLSDFAFIVGKDKAYFFIDGTFVKATESYVRCAEFIELFCTAAQPITLSKKDAALFAATYLPLLEESVQLNAPDELMQLKQVPAQLEFYFDRDKDSIFLAYHVKYGDVVLTPCKDADEGSNVPLRDENLERLAVVLVDEYFEGADAISLDDTELVGALLFGGLARFRAIGEVFTTPAFDRMLFDKKPRIQLGLSIAGNLIDLDVSADDLSKAELAALLGSYRRKKKYHKLSSGAYINLEEMELSQAAALIEDLGITQKQLLSGHFQIPAYRAFYIDSEFEDAKRDPSFTEYVERFKRATKCAFEVPESLDGVLRPYQVEGYSWLCSLYEMGLGGILADEMGLGKSIQLISLLLAKKQQGSLGAPALIVCPASLVYNWVQEFATFAPDMRVCTLEGSVAERLALIQGGNYDVLVASYNIVQKDIDELVGVEFSVCALDEAQYIKNHATLTARAIKRLRAQQRFALTGTPVENRLSEVWSIFDFLMPGFLGSYELFRKRYEIEILGKNEQVAHRLNALISPFVLRRLKKNVLTDLPDKFEQVLYVALPDKQREIYAATEQKLRVDLGIQKKQKKQSGKTKLEILAELTRLRQIALDPSLVFENYKGSVAKTEAIMDLVEQLIDSGQRTLVFSQFTSYLDLLEVDLAKRNISYFRIDGSTPKKQRLVLVNKFNESDSVPVFLISLKAGGTGLNLVGASAVIHADPWWNLAATNQATDRAHRIGQEKDVSVYKVIAKGTIEERILKLQEAKADLANMVISEGGAAALGQLTPDQLLELLG